MSNLCDTSVFVAYLRGNAQISEYINEEQPLCSAVTAAELLQGVENKHDQRTVKKLLSRVIVLPLTSAISDNMLTLIGEFHLSHGLAIPDALIAATAMEHGLTLITHNTKHFSFIPKLAVRAWKDVAGEMNGWKDR